MPETMLHPTTQELTAFGLGKLPDHAAAAVAAHLEKCSACRQAVADVPADSFLVRVRAAGSAGSSFPPSLAQPSNTSRPAMPSISLPDIPPELARHPKYLILRELGRGGMGIVYQARQTIMNRQIVIKVINRALLEQPGALERFHREVQAAAQLSHPNIVTAYDAEQAGELHMLVMEFVPGQSLAEVLEKRGPLPVAYACLFARQVALGLQHAHERGMVHRDIKPQNLMLSLKNQVKILDFGLAKVFREERASTGLTSINAYMGTPDYCAPEQATDARTADIRADLYSLGCTLYCLLAGRPPFREDSFVKTILAHQQQQPQPLPELRPDVPAELWQVVKRLLAKDPAQRYQKPIEVFRALSVFVKPRARPEAKSASVLPQGKELPVKGTLIETDSDIKNILGDKPEKTLPKEVPAKDKSDPFANLVDTSTNPKKAKETRESTKRSPVWWHSYWPALAGIGVLVLALLAMWKGGIFERNTPEDTIGREGATDLDVWRRELSHSDASVRLNAAVALGRRGAEARGAVAELVQRLQEDKDASVREAAALAIGDIARALGGENTEAWMKSSGMLLQLLMNDPSERVRSSAASALGAFGPQAAGTVEFLSKALKDKKAVVRKSAAQAMGQIGEKAVGPLIELVKTETDNTVKKKALESLVRLVGPGQASSAKDLVPFLKDNDPINRLNTALALARIGGESASPALPILSAALKDTDNKNRELAAAALSNLAPAAKAALHELDNALSDTTNPVAVRKYAALAIAHIGPSAEPAVPTVAKALERTNPPEVRHFAAEALSQIGYPANKKVVPEILDAIENDTEKEVRLRCVYALYQMHKADFENSGASKLLTKVLAERDKNMELVRYSAARKLAQVFQSEAPDKTVDVLLEMLRDKSLKVYNGTDAQVEGAGTEEKANRVNVKANIGGDARFLAAEALVWLGKKASGRQEVVDDLEAAAKDPDAKLRQTASDALKELGIH